MIWLTEKILELNIKMRIGLLTTSLGNFGEKGFYNLQEVGLAKNMDSFFDEIKIYKLVSINQEKRVEQVEGCEHSFIYYIPSKGFGINGRLNVHILDQTLDVLIYFSDTQFVVPKVYRWTKKNNICFYPYIGVIKSHSEKKINRIIMDFVSKRNIVVFKKCHCLVKTPKVKEDLQKLGVKKMTVVPVGLDLDLLQKNYKEYGIDELKGKFGYKYKTKIILFVGRMVEEKQPIRMLKIFSQVSKENELYRLVMVGTGPLLKSIEEFVKDNDLSDKVQLLDRVPNNEIWKLYRMADVFINLNQSEIFGMAILEAMYYECKVVAWKAPGPNFIIENGVSGWLIENDEDAVTKILDRKALGEEAKRQVMSKFTWERTGYIIKRLLENSDENSSNTYVL